MTSTAPAKRIAELESLVDAISRTQMMIEFDMDGMILSANENFLAAMGYSLDEIVGRHHRMFVQPAEAVSAPYLEFWNNLKDGEPAAMTFRRITKTGDFVWLEATYNPVLNSRGKPIKVVKCALDVTGQTLQSADVNGKLKAIDRSQAIVEFEVDGTIRTANENFLAAMGYSLNEIVGQHHRMFLTAEDAASQEYREFWAAIARGEFRMGEFRRLSKTGDEVWIQGSYNPIVNADGVVIKVVKCAIDVTRRVRLQAEADEQHRRTHKLTEEIAGCAGEFADGARVIAESSATLSDGAQAQAASVEQINASINQLSESIKVVSQSSRESRDQARATTELATRGGNSVDEALHAMQLIEKSSEQISEIIQVISEIASQTNLLALNAAIEAARAGEHGLGFAVVADEVRKLAERSSEAAKEITQLIKESSRRVDEGAGLSRKVGEALTGIVDAVSRSADNIAAISDQTEAQTANAEQVQIGIKVITDTTESNAASSEELAASAEELTAQANMLQDLVAKYERSSS